MGFLGIQTSSAKMVLFTLNKNLPPPVLTNQNFLCNFTTMQPRPITVCLMLLLFWGWAGVFAQQLIQGRVVADSVSVEGIHVLNLVTEKAVVTDATGKFSISVSEDDLLVFSAVHLEYARKSIGTEELKKGEVVVRMFPKTIALEEVTLTEYPNINAQTLGIIDYKPKSYTPAERRLRTATGWDATANAGTMAGVSFSLDPILNWISGRTAMLKKELEVERRERYQSRLEAYFRDEYFTRDLKIPQEFVKGFKFYVVEDETLQAALDKKNKERTKFELGRLAQDFLSYYEQYNTTDKP
jgi:hypothetical protein